MKRLSRNWSASLGVALGVAALGLGLAGPTAYAASGGAVFVSGALSDLQPTTSEPLDGANAQLTMAAHDGSTTFELRLFDINRSASARTFGAHLHFGPCVAGNGAAALGHYNTDVVAGVSPPQIDETTEVWLDFVVNPAGNATAVTTVPFVPTPGNRSIVIHRDPTNSAGVAGPRLACLPVSW